MSYRCKVCEQPNPPRSPMLRHTTYRPDKTILAEVPVCGPCLKELTAGVPITVLRSRYRQTVKLPEPPKPVAATSFLKRAR